jgi:hypothetical protein
MSWLAFRDYERVPPRGPRGRKKWIRIICRGRVRSSRTVLNSGYQKVNLGLSWRRSYAWAYASMQYSSTCETIRSPAAPCSAARTVPASGRRDVEDDLSALPRAADQILHGPCSDDAMLENGNDAGHRSVVTTLIGVNDAHSPWKPSNSR